MYEHLKQHHLGVNTEWILRPHLLDRLNLGLKRRLTLISAPAGFGKTTLVCQWLSYQEQNQQYKKQPDNAASDHRSPSLSTFRSAWLNLDGNDNQITSFFHHLVAAIQSAISDACPITKSLLTTVNLHPMNYLTNALTNELIAIPTPLVLVLDNYHVIHSYEVHTIVDHLLHYPALPLHVVILTHTDPSIYLGKLRIQQNILELRAPDLRFSPDETHCFFEHQFGKPLNTTLVHALHARTEGRVSKLQESCTVLRTADTDQYLYESLDYDNIFRDVLSAQTHTQNDAVLTSELHRRTSNWFADVGLIDDAISHALVVGDVEYAATLIENHIHAVFNYQIAPMFLERWLAHFCITSTTTHTGLLISKAYLLVTRFNFTSIHPLLERIGTLLDADQTMPSEQKLHRQTDIDFIGGFAAYWQGDLLRAHSRLQRAHTYMPRTNTFIYAQVVFHLALSIALLGQYEAGVSLLQSELSRAEVQNCPTLMILLGAFCAIHLYAAELSKAEQAAKHMLDMSNTPWAHAAWQGVAFVGVWRAWAHYFLGVVAYERNELAVATSYWKQIETMRYKTHPATYHQALVGLALIALATKNCNQAHCYAELAHEFAVEIQNKFALMNSTALETQLYLSTGRCTEAQHIAKELPDRTQADTSIWLVHPLLARLRVLLTDGTPSSLATALRLSEVGLSHAQQAHNIRLVIPFLGLQALILHATHRLDESIHTMEQALELTNADAFVRTFLDLGIPMSNILKEYITRHPQSTYARQLLVAFAQELEDNRLSKQTDQHAPCTSIEPMTPRERELLVLIGQRLTIKEIAQRLVITPNTVKKHITNIYAKLGVANRLHAIARAQELGLLPQE